MTDLTARLAAIKLLLLDVDGVMTDGTIELGSDGIERRRYHARDGIGLRLARDAGIELGLVTSSLDEGIRTRSDRLGLKHVRIGAKDKAEELRRFAESLSAQPSEVAFMGDDLVDLPAMRVAGIAAAPFDADPAVRDQADIVTSRPGGNGAVRELCEMLVAARDPDYLAEKQRCGLLL